MRRGNTKLELLRVKSVLDKASKEDLIYLFNNLPYHVNEQMHYLLCERVELGKEWEEIKENELKK